MTERKMSRLWRRYAVAVISVIAIVMVLHSIWLIGNKDKKSPLDLFVQLTRNSHVSLPLNINFATKTDVHNIHTEGEAATYQRIMKYCNLPTTIGKGMEGQAIPDHRLIHVAVVIRHGDRTSLQSLPTLKNKWSCIFTEEMLNIYPRVAEYVTYMSANRDMLRAPKQLKRMKYLPDKRICGQSELTPQGALQHLVQGSHLHERYVKQHHLIAENWTQGEISFETTYYSRTLQSGLALLYSFLPEFSFAKFDARGIDLLNFCTKNCRCETLHEYWKQNRAEKGLMQNMDQKLAENTKDIARIFDIDMEDIYMSKIQDALSPYICHNMKLPCGRNNCLTLSHLTPVVNFTDTVAMVTNMEGLPRQKYARLYIHPLLTRLVRGMDEIIKNNRKGVKFALYSGHDLTISPLIDTINLPDHAWPPYASRVVFELWENQKTNRHFIAIMYNGKNVTRFARFCQLSTDDYGLCPYEKFTEFVKVSNLKAFNSTTYQEACSKLV